ncbi:MAG: LysR family transcriptional regulator [Rhodoferax sp.]|nr:LysR family transcriptional regulator [Rhodoferax sp.]
MNLHNIEAFLAVADTGSFTAAARRLEKTQSAISQALRQLEDELGVVLIDRTTRQIALTSAGDLLHGRAARLIDDIKAMTSLLREHTHNKLTHLRVGMVDSFSTALVPEFIRGLQAEAHNLSMWTDVTPRLGEAILERRADIVLVNNAFDDEGQLNSHELMREPFVLLLPAEAVWAQPEPDLKLLARVHPMIRYGGISFTAPQIEAQCQRLGITPLRRVSVDSTDKLVASVAAGIGWSIGTPMWLLRTPEYQRTIKVQPLPGDLFFRRLFLVSRRGELDELALRLARLSSLVLNDLVENELRRILPLVRTHIELPLLSAAGADSAGWRADRIS